ncbi:putative transporter [Mollisia scopiformis]|uniref:Putative transporter n=1 Tax=Mollisia scopiformis TaxID=149040 RepID=A0A194XM86_MOLSC|nr:putative transporter [Mollisia scopiformis]KUJ21360.1 putative transporter [Mollisia scopiformis]
MSPEMAGITNKSERADSPSQTCPTLFPTQNELERLGRQRPDIFKTWWAEVGFCFAILGSMLAAEYFISGFTIILPTLSTVLDISAESRTWPANVFSLVTGAFLLPFARLADLYGAYVVFTSGLIWLCIWSLIAGFSQNFLMLTFCRALQGFGPAAFLPAGIMILGSIYRPGPRKNLVFCLYGTFSPLGFFSGIFIGGLSGEHISWGWYFWIASILLALVSAVALVFVPSDRLDPRSEKVKMDWWGAATIVPGLLLVVFAITDSSHAPSGWATPYIPVTLIVGVAFLCGAFYVEGRISENPLLPFSLFKIKSMKPLLVALFFTYGVFGVYLFYASFYIMEVIGVSALRTTAWFAPMAVGGLVLATVGGFTLHLLPGKALLIASGIGYVVSVLLFALIPEHFSYWAYIFPAMLGSTLGVDVTYSVSNVFITTSLPKHQQGLAGAVVWVIIFLGIGFFLGAADVVVSATAHLGLRESYKAAFWFGTGCAGLGLFLLAVFVDVGQAKSALTADEKNELEAGLTG